MLLETELTIMKVGMFQINLPIEVIPRINQKINTSQQIELSGLITAPIIVSGHQEVMRARLEKHTAKDQITLHHPKGIVQGIVLPVLEKVLLVIVNLNRVLPISHIPHQKDQVEIHQDHTHRPHEAVVLVEVQTKVVDRKEVPEVAGDQEKDNS